jgi:hypothetical protein
MKKHIITIILAAVTSFAASALTITATVVASMPSSLPESSGLDYTGNGTFWSHNDGYGDEQIYKISSSGSITKTIAINNAVNYDWEDVAHDAGRDYMFLGDFGNNACSRTNLHIYRITHPKNVSGTSVNAEVINFSYPDQVQFPSQWMNFDAEGFFHYNGLLYVFTKPDGNAVGYTKMYTVPDEPGTYVATLVDSFYTNDRITSADINADATAAIISTGSHIHIFTGWSGGNIFSGTHTQVNISGTWTQKEALAFKDINHVYMTDEDNGSGNNLYVIDLSAWITDMSTSVGSIASGSDNKITAFPNPANNLVSFRVSGTGLSAASIQLFDIAGNKLRDAMMSETTGFMSIETADLPSGVYFYRLFDNDKAVLTQRLVISH